jgi:hypothetical protein
VSRNDECLLPESDDQIVDEIRTSFYLKLDLKKKQTVFYFSQIENQGHDFT